MPEPKEPDKIDPEEESGQQNGDNEDDLTDYAQYLPEATEEMKKICSILSGGEEDPDYYDRLIPKEPSDWKGILDCWAERHARRHRLDPESVKAVYHRCDEIGWVAKTSPSPTTGLDLAFQDLEPQQALELFENALSLENLRTGYNAFTYLTKKLFEPFCTLPELADLTAEFISFQEKHRDHIIQTGFPKQPFLTSRWFDWHLGRLYYVKPPVNEPAILFNLDKPGAFYNNNPDRWNGRDSDYYSIWAKELNKEENTDGIYHASDYQPPFLDPFYLSLCRLEDDKFINHEGIAIAEECPYEEASCFDFVSSEMASRMGELRENVFELRIEILKIIAQTSKYEKSDKLWVKCRDLLTEKLDFDACQYLLKTDRLFIMKIHETPLMHPYKYLCDVNRNAGLSDIFHVIGHFEKELSIGAISKAKKLLEPVTQDGKTVSYFQIVDSDKQEQVDKAIDLYLKLRESEREFYLDFQARVNETLENDFEMDIPLTFRGKRGNRYEFSTFMKPYGQSISAYLDQTGQLPKYGNPFEVLDVDEDCTMSQGTEEFRHSPSYHSFMWRDKDYTVTNSVASIIRIMHEAYKNKTPDVGGDYLLTAIGSNSKSLKDLLKDSSLWNTLIISKRKGSYRLDIP